MVEEDASSLEVFQKFYDENDSSIDTNIQSFNGNYMGAYLKTITDSISKFQGTTLEDLFSTIKSTTDLLLNSISKKNIVPKTRSIISLKAESELLMCLLHKYASKRSGEDYPTLKARLVHITKDLYDLSIHAKEKISKLFLMSIKNNSTIMVHGYSSTVAFSLVQARKSGKRFKVYVSVGQPSNSGQLMMEELKKNDIESKLIYDCSVGFYMKDVDFVAVGSDVICENGGIVNKIGTYTIAIVAKNFKKPLYVLSDSLKFIKMYPISQVDVQQNLSKFTNKEEGDDIICDYTPPEFINLFFTDIGILTPSAVSDELIQIFYT